MSLVKTIPIEHLCQPVDAAVQCAWRLFLAFILIASPAIALPLIGGCQRESEEPAVDEDEGPTEDPTYQTAESLINEYVVMMSGMAPRTAMTMNLYYAETIRQKTLLEWWRTAMPVCDLEFAMRSVYKRSLHPSFKDYFYMPTLKSGRITQNTGDRAVAECVDSQNKTRTMKLVKVGDRWWISCLTLEEQPIFQGASDVHLKASKINLRILAGVAPSMHSRVRAKEFRSAQQVEDQLRLAAQEYLRGHAPEYMNDEPFMEQNPKMILGIEGVTPKSQSVLGK